MKLLRHYLDTSVFNFIFEHRDLAKRDATIRLFDELRKAGLTPFVSDLVLAEIGAATADKSARLMAEVESAGAVNLPVSPEAVRLAESYMEHGMLGEKNKNDALHVACATVHDMDVVVSWNLEHLVKLKTRRVVNAVNRLLGYRDIEICRPEEVVE